MDKKAPAGGRWDSDGKKEQEMLQFVFLNADYGDTEGVIMEIDQFCWEKDNWMMTIGDVKGKILDDTVKETCPKVALELGTYCGYSALRIRRHMPKGSILITLDVNEEFQDIAKQLAKYAGLFGKIDFWLGGLE